MTQFTFFCSFKSRNGNPKLHLEWECGTVGKDGTPRVLKSPAKTELAPMGITKINQHEYRPCRVCALEQVLGLASSTGRPRTAVTFSGQFLPEEEGANSFKWDEVSNTGAARLERVAKQTGLHTTYTSSGPVAYGVVTLQMLKALKKSLRVYELYPPCSKAAKEPGVVTSKAKSEPRIGGVTQDNYNAVLAKIIHEEAGPVADHAIATYWALRNHMPPEIYGNETTMVRTAVLLTRAGS
jgi:hypothetical protein